MTGARRAIVVVDLAFGDCGKGLIVDALVRRYSAGLVVRFNGGPQAGHNVVAPDGRHHTFTQFGSGTFVDGVRTFLSRYMLIEPYALLNEAAHLEEIGIANPWDRLLIDGRCPVISPAHQAANRLLELARGNAAHGTCGMGIGQTMQDLAGHPEVVLQARELADPDCVRSKLLAACDLKVRELASVKTCHDMDTRAQTATRTLLDPSWIDVAIDNYRLVSQRASILAESQATELLRGELMSIYEGAQGVLLDERFGFHPFTTWSTTTTANAHRLMASAGWAGDCINIGVLRTYMTRHGPGPMVTEEPFLRSILPEMHNCDDGWQGPFRTGVFDLVAARYSTAVAGPLDGLAITHLDRLPQLPPRICTHYSGPGLPSDFHVHPQADLTSQGNLTRALFECQPVFSELRVEQISAFLDRISGELGVPIAITSSGNTSAHVRFAAGLGCPAPPLG